MDSKRTTTTRQTERQMVQNVSNFHMKTLQYEKSYKLLVRLIDGAETWVPINVRHIIDDQYEILDDKEYHDLDESVLFEFFPGDIVIGDSEIIPDGDYEQARQLIKPGAYPDRKYFEFKYRATLRKLSIDQHSADKYRSEIERIKKEKLTGHFFYRGILEAVTYLEQTYLQKPG